MLDMQSGDQPLGYLLFRVAHALRTDVTVSVLDPVGLSFPQYICLRILARSPGRSNAELARDTQVSPQAMNMVLRGLQERGLVSRPVTVAAGRSLPAQLTDSGTEVLGRIDTGVRDAERRLLSTLSADQRREFRQILTTLGAE
jgi:DNA-binding MarR family transcriptional regulator